VVIDRRALPGVTAGLVGLLAAIVGMAADQAWLVVAAGLCALLAGLSTLGLAERLRKTDADTDVLSERASKLEAESDRMAARAAQFEAEALKTRGQLAEAMRSEMAWKPRADAVNATADADPVTDAVTGMFNERFFMATLEKRVSAARRGLRPLALGLLEVVNGVAAGASQPSDARMVATALTDTLREADTVARLDDGHFAVLLEDTPENGAIWTIERVRRRLAETEPGHTLWAGLSCYPAHAFDTDQLMHQAHAALVSAKEWRQDRIEVAATPD